MNMDPLHFKIGGVFALATAGCALVGAGVGAAFGLGGQNLPVGTYEQLQFLAENRTPFLIREWLYLWLAVFGMGEGLGLYYLLRESPLAIWTLIAWIVGLAIGVVEDAAVIAIVNQVAAASFDSSAGLNDAFVFTAGLAFETIKTQQFVSILLCSTLGYCLFSIIGYRAGKLPLWLCIVGILGGVTTGLFGFCNVVPSFEQTAAILENGFGLLVVWDIGIGILLLSAAKRVSIFK